MLRMPDGTQLVKEMTEALPLFCYSKKRNTKSFAAQGIRLGDKERLEVIAVSDFLEAGGVMCHIQHDKSDRVLVMSVTGLDFKDNGSIDENITKYENARIEWLKQEEFLDVARGTTDRIRVFGSSGDPSKPTISRNAPCYCGSGKKYKNCCGK